MTKIKITENDKQLAQSTVKLATQYKQEIAKTSMQLKLTKIKENLRIIKKLNILKANIIALIFDLTEWAKTEEIYNSIRNYNKKSKFNQIKTGIVLTVMDYIINNIIMSTLPKIIPNKLADLFGKLLIKIADMLTNMGVISGIKTPEQIYRESAQLKVDEYNKQTKVFSDKLGIKSNADIINSIQGNDYWLSKFLITVAIGGTVNEEGSKEIAARTGCGVAYSIIFNTIEFSSYVFLKQADVKDRLQGVLMHVINSILHNFPKLRPFAYLIHAVSNGIVPAMHMIDVTSKQIKENM